MLKNIILVICTAVLLVLSFPNFNFPFLIWFALVPFFFLLDGKSPKAAFFWGWLTGYLFFLGTHFWLVHVTLPGMLLVNLYLGIYFGIFGLGYAYLARNGLKPFPTIHQLWILPSLWVVCELARDRLFTGFGWACLGHSQYQILPLIQIADITGVFGVSFLVVMVNVWLKGVIKNIVSGSPIRAFGDDTGKGYGELPLTPSLKKEGGKLGNRVAVPILVILIMFGVVLGYGYFKISADTVKQGSPLRIAVVQPNIPQSRKWEPESWDEIHKHILDLTTQAIKQKPDLLIWPETSFPGYLWQSPERYEEIKNFVARQKIPLLLGAVTTENGAYYNSAILLLQKGEEAARYNKMHLVPFGEFLPLRPFLNFIENFVPIGDFDRGERLTVFPVEAAAFARTFSVLICFEDTVAPVVRALTQNGAQFLVNITNDGWFKDTNAPYLHLQASVFQAVANRRPIVRAANTGVSGFISSSGKAEIFRDASGKAVMAEGFLVSKIYGEKKFSFYTRFGDAFAYLCFLAVGAALIKRKYCL